MLPAVALVSVTRPRVGALTVRLAAVTRMPSTRSSWSKAPVGSGKLAVNATGVGSALPLPARRTLGVLPSSVSGGWLGSCDGTYSCTVPCTCTRLPTAASADGSAPVNTKMPSEVSGSASASASGACRKKPLLRRAVTMPLVATTWSSSGERSAAPWMAWIGTRLKSSLRMVPVACSDSGIAPVTSFTSTRKVSSGSLAVSPSTCTVIEASVSPSAMVSGVAASAV